MVNKHRRSDNRGFTLIELLIVMVIIGLLASLVGPRLFGKVEKSKQKSAKAQISLLENALDLYRLDVGKYPTTQMGLESLRSNTGNAKNWDGPYLPKELPQDPWGNSYQYRCPGQHGEYDLYSFGADGQEGGDGDNQDIVSWKGL